MFSAFLLTLMLSSAPALAVESDLTDAEIVQRLKSGTLGRCHLFLYHSSDSDVKPGPDDPKYPWASWSLYLGKADPRTGVGRIDLERREIIKNPTQEGLVRDIAKAARRYLKYGICDLATDGSVPPYDRDRLLQMDDFLLGFYSMQDDWVGDCSASHDSDTRGRREIGLMDVSVKSASYTVRAPMNGPALYELAGKEIRPLLKAGLCDANAYRRLPQTPVDNEMISKLSDSAVGGLALEYGLGKCKVDQTTWDGQNASDWEKERKLWKYRNTSRNPDVEGIELDIDGKRRDFVRVNELNHNEPYRKAGALVRRYINQNKCN